MIMINGQISLTVFELLRSLLQGKLDEEAWGVEAAPKHSGAFDSKLASAC